MEEYTQEDLQRLIKYFGKYEELNNAINSKGFENLSNILKEMEDLIKEINNPEIKSFYIYETVMAASNWKDFLKNDNLTNNDLNNFFEEYSKDKYLKDKNLNDKNFEKIGEDYLNIQNQIISTADISSLEVEDLVYFVERFSTTEGIKNQIKKLNEKKQNSLIDGLSMNRQKELISYFSSNIQIKKLKESPVLYWWFIDPKVQKDVANSELLTTIIYNEKDNPEIVEDIWKKSDPEIQKEKIVEIIERVQGSPDDVSKVWSNINSVIRLKKFSEVFEKIGSSNNSEYYESFVKNYLGDEIEFNEDRTPYIPEDLKKIISNINDSQQAEKIEKNLAEIIKNWNEIKQYIQLKRANSIVNDGIEIRKKSINEILNAVEAMNRPMANTISAQEFEQIEGSERVGVDTQYKSSSSTAVQRAYTLAEMMDSALCKKAYPNFSVKNEEGTIELNVLHPQDKSAILLGYDTHCCFRPNGVADNEAKNEYSLLQYCTTTPCGGVLRCENADNADTKEIYMGTPFLVNGNCMMFHSYETINGKEADATNKLLVEAAKSAIEKSEGSINIVFMTDLHIGSGRLDFKDKIIIPSYFRAYTEGEYSKYSGMYTNLEYQNCILAARVGDEVLSGKKLLDWYTNECEGNYETLKEKLKLHMGERTGRFDFGRREIEETIKIPEYELVEEFYKKKIELEQLRETLAIVLQIKKLKSKSVLSKNEQDELTFLKSKIEGKIDITKIEKISIDDIRAKIKENSEEQLALYSGEDIDLIAKVRGIDIEKEARNREQGKQNSKKTKDKKKSAEGKAIRILLAKTRDSKDERVKSIENLNEKIAKNKISDEELTVLEQADIDVTQYRSTFRKNEEQDINSQNNEEQDNNQNNEQTNIKQQVRKIMNDKALKETIVSELLWKDISKEEINTKSKAIFKVSLIDELKRKVATKNFQKGIENLTEQEIETVNQEVQMINTNKLVESIINGDIEQKNQSILKKYEIDIETLKAKISDKESIKRSIRKDKLEKLKARITLGLNTRVKIQSIMKTIDGKENSTDNIAQLKYGRSWYIALDSKGAVLYSNRNEEIDKDGVEKDKYEKNLEELEEHKTSESETLEKTSIKNVIEQVPVEDKQKAIRKIKQENQKEETKAVEGDGIWQC